MTLGSVLLTSVIKTLQQTRSSCLRRQPRQSAVQAMAKSLRHCQSPLRRPMHRPPSASGGQVAIALGELPVGSRMLFQLKPRRQQLQLRGGMGH